MHPQGEGEGRHLVPGIGLGEERLPPQHFGLFNAAEAFLNVACDLDLELSLRVRGGLNQTAGALQEKPQDRDGCHGRQDRGPRGNVEHQAE